MQQTNGSVRHETKTNSSSGLRASTIARVKKKWALAVLGKKIGSGSIFVAINFDQNCANKTYTFLRPEPMYPRASINGTYIIYVLLRQALPLTFVLCVLWQKKHPTF